MMSNEIDFTYKEKLLEEKTDVVVSNRALFLALDRIVFLEKAGKFSDDNARFIHIMDTIDLLSSNDVEGLANVR